MHYEHRIQKVRAKMLEQNIEVLICNKTETVERFPNIRYLCGFNGSEATLLIDLDLVLLIVDGRYGEVAQTLQANFLDLEVVVIKSQKEVETSVKNFVKSRNKVLLQQGTTDSQKSRFEKILGIKSIPLTNIVADVRLFKSPEEIKFIAAAQTFVNQVLTTDFESLVEQGITEKELAFKLEIALRDGGKYDLSFPFPSPIIVAFGSNSAKPHHAPGETRLVYNQNILIDCGIIHEGYCTDITRNYWFGDTVNEEYQAVFDILLEAQIKALESLQEGADAAQVDTVCSDDLGQYAAFYKHSLGHGVGMEIHEAPGLSRMRPDTILKEGMVVTCEPGIYLEGRFGIRIEDLLVVQKDSPRVLSEGCDKRLQIIN